MMRTSSTDTDALDETAHRVVGHADSGALQRYGKLKLELAGIIRSILDRARESKDEDFESRARKLLVRLSEDRFYLAVLGQHKRGKSSLMNAMIGRDLLPTGILPVTSAIVALRYDSTLKIQIHQKSWSYPREIPLDQLPDYVSEQGNPGNRKQVISAEIGVPVDLLRYGFYFVDTPGIGSAIAANTATTKAFLPEADAAIFVTSFDSPMNELELSFLDQIHQHVRKLFFVINKRDLVSGSELAEVTAFVRLRIAERIGHTEFRLYAVSANAQIAAAKEGNSMPGDPGIEELRKDLQTFLVTEKTREFLIRVAHRANNLLESERLQANLVQWTSGTPDAGASAEMAIGNAADKLISTARQTIRDLSGDVASKIEQQFVSGFGVFRDAQITSVTGALNILFHMPKLFFSLFEVPDELDRVRLSFESSVAEWLKEHSSEFEAVVHDAAAPHAKRLATLAPGVLVSAAGGLGLTTPNEVDEAFESADPVAELPLRMPAKGPAFDWKWRPPWWCFLLPARWVGNWAAQQALRTFTGASEQYESRLRELVVSAGKRWLDELTMSVESTIRLRADHIHRTLTGQVTRDAFRQVESDLRRVEAMTEELRGGDGVSDPDNAAAIAESGINPNSLKPCVMCRGLSAALASFLSRYQYELATNHDRQLSHAECGGFCPLHTWMYESIASPQGVSAGYAPTLERISQLLRSAVSSAPPTLLAGEVASTLSNPQRCPACRMLDNAEHDLIAVQAMAVRQRQRPSLCLPHAEHVLQAVADEQAAKELILDRAAALERIAEDMRLFALKTDAVRHHLTVEDEEYAFRRGLQQLVGERNLAMSRRVD
jgi:GTP-binding protein EngB required for normal cell division